MKLKMKPKTVVYMALAAAALVIAVIVMARVCFGYDVFDRSGWRSAEDGTYRYLDYYGDPVLGWKEIDGNTYYFSPEQDGVMATGWLDTAEGRFFLRESGLKTIGWAELENGRYYFDENGVMATDWLDTAEGRYYLNEDGVMQTGWLDTPEGRCYLSETGAVTAGWVDAEDGRYYIDDGGSVYTGWLEVDGRTYYLNEDGTMHTGWLEMEGDRYYFKEDGAMAVGRVEIDGSARYFTSSGKYFVLVNRWSPVPEDYELDLVWYDGFQVDSSCLADLADMVAACRADGYACNITSAYRGVNYQTTLFERKVNKLMAAGYTRAAAEAETGRSIAVPGTSEHHLGLAVDIKNGYSTYGWLAKNSWKYGFNFRYPEGTTSLTGIYYEPWHYRYVGKELAAELYELDLCLEAYMNQLTEQAAS